jgi:hypothetical protein
VARVNSLAASSKATPIRSTESHFSSSIPVFKFPLQSIRFCVDCWKLLEIGVTVEGQINEDTKNRIFRCYPRCEPEDEEVKTTGSSRSKRLSKKRKLEIKIEEVNKQLKNDTIDSEQFQDLDNIRKNLYKDFNKNCQTKTTQYNQNKKMKDQDKNEEEEEEEDDENVNPFHKKKGKKQSSLKVFQSGKKKYKFSNDEPER